MKKPEGTQTGDYEGKKYTEVRTFFIKRTKVWDNGNVTFDLEVNGVVIYGCRVIETQKGDFISFPQQKGNNGKYYHIAYIALSPDDQTKILGAVEKVINDGQK